MIITYEILFETPERKKSLGSSKRGWKDPNRRTTQVDIGVSGYYCSVYACAEIEEAS
jgi:hypothetical protein